MRLNLLSTTSLCVLCCAAAPGHAAVAPLALANRGEIALASPAAETAAQATGQTAPQATGQTAPQATDQTAPQPAGQTVSASDQPASTEIVVTALRSTTSVQNTPAAVTVIRGEQIRAQQILDVRDLESVVPATKFAAANASTRIFMRGVGSTLDFYWIPEFTAVNLNGTYLPRFATTGSFYDIDSVQALPGPQGVLYGRSAGGGAVLINTRRPVNRAEASGSFDYGNYDTYRFEGMANVPISKNLAARGAVDFNKHSGYQSFDQQSANSFSVRLSALYRPSDALSVYLWGTYFKNHFHPTVAVYYPFLNKSNPWAIPAVDPRTGGSNTTGLLNENFRYWIGGYEVRLKMDGVTLEYAGSALRQKEDAQRSLFGNPSVQINAMTQYTQSLHAYGSIGQLDFIGGVDWLYAPSRFLNYSTRVGTTIKLGNNFPSISTRNLSGFAQGTFHLNPGLRVVAGARYTRDSLHLAGSNQTATGNLPVTFDHSWRHLDLKGGVEADLGDAVLLYANVQTGYAPGTLNTLSNTIAVDKEVQPQTLLAYTAGFKSQFLDRKVTLNVEGFDYGYKKLIVQATNVALSQSVLFNVPKTRIYGFQVTSALNFSRNDTLSANVGYTHGRYGPFKASAAAPNLNRLQTVFTPDWTGNVSYNHRFDLTNGAAINARVSTYFSSSYWGTFDHTSGARQGSYTKTDASLRYSARDNAWYIGAWVKNLENKPIATTISLSGYALYPGAAFLEPPRTYGGTVGFAF